MARRRHAHTAGLALAVAALALPAAAQGQLGDSEATSISIAPNVKSADFPVTQFGQASRTGTARWTTVLGTGNCCEHYLTATADGTLVDFGGNYPNFTSDLGKTWKSARPLAPFLGGEGAIAPAPGGDIVGVGWDPYTGDRLISFKYVATTGKWLYRAMAMHSPFFDREWIGVVPGPWTIDGRTVPYLTFVRGGWPSKEYWLMSTDGLTYQDASSTFADATLSETVIGSLTVTAGHDLDWIQPHVGMGVTPLGGGRALAAPDEVLDSWTMLDRDTRKWRRFQAAGSVLSGSYQSDSGGRVHQVRPAGSDLEYRMTTDGGVTWHAAALTLPDRFEVEEYDFRAVHALGIAVVAVHASDGAVDQDFVFKLAVAGQSPVLLRRYEVGLGDAPVGSSLASTGDRFDFASVAVLPDGRVATSYYDSTTGGRPGLAIEQGSDLAAPSGAPPALEPSGGGADPGPPPSPDPSTTPTAEPSTTPTAEPSTTPTAEPSASPTATAPPRSPEHSTTSDVATIQDRISTALALPDPARFTVTLKIRARRARGSVGVARAGVAVRIQRYAKRRWRTVARTRTDGRGRYSVAIRVTRGTRLRAVVAGTPERPGDASGTKRA